MVADKKNLFVVNIDIKRLYERIRAARVGDVITYEELNRLAGFDVQQQAGRQKLSAARKRALKVDRLLFSAVPNTGIQCCNDEEIVSAGGKTIRVVRSMARTGIRKLAALRSYGDLSNDRKIEYNVAAAQLGMLEHAAGTKQTRALGDSVRAANSKLQIGSTLQELGKKTK
jgi:hypothetical protein